MDIMFPDYDNSILGVSSSILAHYGARHNHPGLPILDSLLRKPAKNTLFMVLDGLGSSLLANTLPAGSFLRSNKVADISSVYPCTTAAATTTLQSGLSPLEHGWIGWNAWFREYGRVIDLFLDRDSFCGTTVSPSPAGLLLPYEDILAQIGRSRPDPPQFHRIMPSFEPDGVGSLPDMISRIESCCKLDGEQLILAYWHEPDTLLHSEGPGSEAVAREVAEEDRLIAEMFAGLKNTRIMLTADHGQVEITREVFLDDVPEIMDCLILPPSLETRMTSLFVKPQRLAGFPRLFNDYFGDSYILLTKSEVFERGLLGHGIPHRKVDDFVGDFLACATGSTIIRYNSLFGRTHNVFKGHHAGLCRDEMTVPLIWAET